MRNPAGSIRLLLVLLGVASCGGSEPARGASPAVPAQVHLADELGNASVTGASAPESARAERSWSFAEPRPEWHAIGGEAGRRLAGVELERVDDAARLKLTSSGEGFGPPIGGIVTELDGLPLADWTGVLVRARTHDRLGGIAAAYNVDERGALPGPFAFIGAGEGAAPVFDDGSTQSYFLPFLPRSGADTLRSVGLFLGSVGPGSLDVLSIALVPRGAAFLDDHGVTAVTRDSVTRHSIFAHVPARLAWRVGVPAGGRLDVGLACLPDESVTYRASVRAGSGDAEVLMDERVDDADVWKQLSLDLSPWAGKEVELTLAASGERPGSVALWGAPVLSGAPAPVEASAPAPGSAAPRPNVVFYVIDGGGADLMSLYRYGRSTTPFLEELAKDGVVFERAFSNSTWTQASTVSFMTSLQHSVLGGLRRGVHSTPVPAAAVTMAEHMRRGGYLTVSFTANPNAGRVVGLERGVDVMWDMEEGAGHSTSSEGLQAEFWRLRDDYPGDPCWVHFQTTDVHEPNQPVAPFAGRFVTPEDRERERGWDNRIFQTAGDLFGTTSVADFYDRALAKAGIPRHEYYDTRRGLYDETMLHQDEELRRFVEKLKERGEWEDTLLVIAADHGHPAATFARWGRGLVEPPPEGWQGALFDAYSTRVPLIFVWPARIAGGRRFDEPVSMIDVLPTILDLAGLPQPEVRQGRSLAPLLLGGPEAHQEPHEVILDEFRVDATGALVGNIEVVDGRWGASLEIGPPDADPTLGRHAIPAGGRWGAVHPFFPDVPRLLLYDLEKDPFALSAVNDEHPELVERYTRLLQERWKAHQALAQRFSAGEAAPLDVQQLEQLRALGYIR